MGKCTRAIRSRGSGAWCYWVLLGGAFWRLDSGEVGTEMWMNLLAANRNVHMPLYGLVWAYRPLYALVARFIPRGTSGKPFGIVG